MRSIGRPRTDHIKTLNLLARVLDVITRRLFRSSTYAFFFFFTFYATHSALTFLEINPSQRSCGRHPSLGERSNAKFTVENSSPGPRQERNRRDPYQVPEGRLSDCQWPIAVADSSGLGNNSKASPLMLTHHTSPSNPAVLRCLT